MNANVVCLIILKSGYRFIISVSLFFPFANFSIKNPQYSLIRQYEKPNPLKASNANSFVKNPAIDC